MDEQTTAEQERQAENMPEEQAHPLRKTALLLLLIASLGVYAAAVIVTLIRD